MYAKDNKIKIGKVTIEHYFQDKYTRLRFTYPKGKRQVITIGMTTQTNRDVAFAKANEINTDIAGDKVTGLYSCFDETLVKYDPNRQSVALEVVEKEKEPTIKELWEQYKEKQKGIAAQTTQLSIWKEIDNLLAKLSNNALLLKNIDSFGKECLKKSALSCVHRYFQSIQPALRLEKGYEQIQLKKQLPKLPKKTIEWFEPKEVNAILDAIKNNRFQADRSCFKHSFYYPYAAFCAYTGCRPEEVIALTWNDLRWNEDKTKCSVKINKAYSKGILKHETKNHVIRIFPLASNLVKILKKWIDECPKTQNNLVFPSPKGFYMKQDNYGRRLWKPITTKLVKAGLIEKHLPPYNLRHSFVTNLHYNHHVSFAVIAGLIGDRVETVIKNYTGLKPFDAGEMPNIY